MKINELLDNLLHNKPRTIFWAIVVIFIIVTIYKIKVILDPVSMSNSRMKKTNESVGYANDILDTGTAQVDKSINNLALPELAQPSNYYDNDTRDLFKQSAVNLSEKDRAKAQTKEDKRKEKIFPLEFNGVMKMDGTYIAILKEPATGKVYFKKENEQVLDMYLRNIFSDKVILVRGNNREEIELHRAGKNTGDDTLNKEEGM